MIKKLNVVSRDTNNFHKISYNGKILLASGAGLSRVFQHLKSGNDFLIITNFKSDRSQSENERIFTRLPERLRNLLDNNNIGGIWLIGHWTECVFKDREGLRDNEKAEDCEKLGGTLVDAVEQSWLFNKPSNISGQKWLEGAKFLARIYDQNAFVIRLAGETSVRSAEGQIWDVLRTEDSIEKALQNLAWLRKHKTAFGYSELRKLNKSGRDHKIVFTPQTQGTRNKQCVYGPQGIYFSNVLPGSISGRQMFYYQKINALETSDDYERK